MWPLDKNKRYIVTIQNVKYTKHSIVMHALTNYSSMPAATVTQVL